MDLLPANVEVLQVDQHLVGLEDHVNTCVKELEKMHGSTFMLCLTGMGGVGKTTLAKAIYNRLIGRMKFEAMSYLEIDRISPSSMEIGSSLVTRLQRQLVWDVFRVPVGSQERYNFWFNKISRQGPVLIVMDDIQDKTQFDKLIPSTSLIAPGSCIIITSRDSHVLNLISKRSKSYLHEVSLLGCEDSMRLFNWHAFGDKEALPGYECVASDVSNACGGLPLALKVVGSSLCDKTSDEDRKCIWPEAVKALKRDRAVTCALKWSYDCLSEPEKMMFVDIACVFHGWGVNEAMQVWKSCEECSSCCGFESPNTYLKSLEDKSLIIIEADGSRKLITMHGLLRDMGQNIGLVDGSHLWNGEKAMRMIEIRSQVLDSVRAINLTNEGKRMFEVDKCPKMPNLHYLTLNGCDVSGDLGSISKELRCLQWRNMPLRHAPPILNLFNLVSVDFSRSANLVSLDFSSSSILAKIWVKSSATLEGCPNLLKLDLSYCDSVTRLPESVGRLSRLEVLDLQFCLKLRKLPDSVGHLTALKKLLIQGCRSLKALPKSMCALSGLQSLFMGYCNSIWKLRTIIRLPLGVSTICIDLVSEARAVGIGQLHALNQLIALYVSDEAITALDRSGALGNLTQLSRLTFLRTCMTKLPRTLGLLTNLDSLALCECGELQELPNSFGQLKVLRTLSMRNCSTLESLPESFGALAGLRHLQILKCTSLTKIPASVGHLSSLQCLVIEGCGELQPLPHSLRQLEGLERLRIQECGSLEGLGLLRVLRGLRIWGCTSTTELPGSYLDVVDSNGRYPASFEELGEFSSIRRNVREVRVVEVNDCGYLRHVQDDSPSARLIVQRVHKLPCYNFGGGKECPELVSELVGLRGPI